MPLTNVTFDIIEDGLGIIAAKDDNISAILFPTTAPDSYSGAKIKGYTDINAVKADGITATSVTYGEAYYHISEFFRISAGALLYVCFNLTDAVEELYNFTGGKVRQYGAVATSLANVEAVHQANANAFVQKYAPLSIIVGYEPTSTPANIGVLDDLALKIAPNVSVVAFGDGGGRGIALAGALGKPYISAVGTVLGLVSKANVQESIGANNRFNFSDGVEFAAIKYVTGESYSDGSTTQYDLKRYLSPRKYANYAGVYLEKDPTATAATKDLSSVRNNRVIGKALRGIRAKLLVRLKSTIEVDSNGMLEPDVIEYFKSLASQDLQQMQRDGEISQFGVYINPDQNVLSTDKLEIEIRVIPVGVANFINVRLGFTRSLAGFQ